MTALVTREMRPGETNPCRCSAEEHYCEEGEHWSITPGCICGCCSTTYPCKFCKPGEDWAMDF